MFISFSKFLGNTGIRVGLGFKTGGRRKKKSTSASIFSALGIFFVVMFQIMLYTVLFTGWCCYAIVYGIIWMIKSIISAFNKNKQSPTQSNSPTPPNSEDKESSDSLTDFLKPIPEQPGEPPKNKKPIFSENDKKILIIVCAIVAFIALSAFLSECSDGNDETTTARSDVETMESSTFKTETTTSASRTTKQTTSKTTTAKTTVTTTETTPSTTETLATTTTTRETTTKETTSKTETTEREYDYVLNTNSYIFHRPSCRHANRISDANRSEYHGTRSSVISKGYSPCGTCKP